MPGYDTHYLFGIKAYKKLPDSKIKEAIKKMHTFSECLDLIFSSTMQQR